MELLKYFKIKKYRRWLIVSSLLLIFGLWLMGVTGRYADNVAGPSLNDIILDHLPVINLSIFYVYIYLSLLIFLIIYPALYYPEKLPITVFTIAIVAILRAIFIAMTHLGPPIEDVQLTLTGLPEFIKGLYFNADLFFSGHVAVPFLGFFLFKNRKIKWFWLFAAIFEAAVNLLMHTHYSIDIFAAPFISYTSFKFSEWLFNKKIKIDDIAPPLFLNK